MNNNKSSRITFTRQAIRPQIRITNEFLPTKIEVKHLELHLDEKLNCKLRVEVKKQRLPLKVNQINWLTGKRSQLTIKNKVFRYKTILVSILTAGIELWGCAKPNNTKIAQKLQ